MKTMYLKDRAIYQLPNGREVVADLTEEGQAVLQNLSPSDPDKYELNEEGRLLFNGQLSAWGVNDLVDTGRIAPPHMTTILHESWMMEPERGYESL